MNAESEPIPVFVPALGTILIAAEDAKGEPLIKNVYYYETE